METSHDTDHDADIESLVVAALAHAEQGDDVARVAALDQIHVALERELARSEEGPDGGGSGPAA